MWLDLSDPCVIYITKVLPVDKWKRRKEPSSYPACNKTAFITVTKKHSSKLNVLRYILQDENIHGIEFSHLAQIGQIHRFNNIS